MAKKDRCAALYEISMVDFLLTDMMLYLDTHPNDKNALDYYHHYAKILKELREDFAVNYGPLLAEQSNCGKTWEWSSEPNAWEGVC
ncbi:MAG: spore coat protein CotJB [Lachnospiraceae bacterium]|nr:spore coat protein CotJB [Lachnospiraceae bacterium]